jgi:HSP20 family molecular chaperone IbpA
MPKFNSVRVPRADVLDSGTELTLILDLPGVVETGVELVVEKQILKVRATPEGFGKALEEPTHALLVEKSAAIYERTFRLQNEIDATAIHANLADGVLTVHLPKKTDGGPRRIPVVLAG